MKEILKYLRVTNSFSQNEIAGKIGVSRQSYIKYENGTVIPSEEILKKLAEAYNISIDTIKSGTIPTVSVPSYTIHHPEQNGLFLNDSGTKKPDKTIEYDAIYDGTAVRVLDDSFKFRKGMRFKVVIEDEETKSERKRKAWEVLQSFAGTARLSENSDYKTELEKSLREKYGYID